MRIFSHKQILSIGKYFLRKLLSGYNFMLVNYFPLGNILQANNTFVLFICSLYWMFSFFVLIY